MGCLNMCVIDTTHRLNSVEIYAKDMTHRFNAYAAMMCVVSLKYDYFKTDDGYFSTNEGFRFRVVKNQ